MTVLYFRRGDITTNNRVDKYRSIRGIIGKVYQKYLIYISYYTMMALVRDVGWIWPTFMNVLHHAKRHDLSYVIDHAA